ncbi:MAG: tryptophan--tRNA ligase, partial [Planctomycetota bacterium]|nr:tryptophan--tRNA ligase [Planctomycetota bacterium]
DVYKRQLIYRSDVVPVGEDQAQHIEVAQDIAQSFNAVYGPILKRPEAKISPAARVPGTDGRKMSKSYGNTIEIFAEGNALKKAVMGIVTDSKTVADQKDPDGCNVFALYRLMATPAEIEDLRSKYLAGGMGYGDAKKMLLAKIDATFGPFREARMNLASDPGYVLSVLREGAARARTIAAETMADVRKAVGISL